MHAFLAKPTKCILVHNSINMAPIDDALNDLKTQKQPNYTQTAKKYGILRSTLSRRHRGVTGSRDDQHEDMSLLSQQQQKELISYINELCDEGLPPLTAMVRNFAHDICGTRPGKNWVYRFVQSYRDILQSGYLEGYDLSRKKADNGEQVKRYFETVSR
jgi:hypothetical protein